MESGLVPDLRDFAGPDKSGSKATCPTPKGMRIVISVIIIVVLSIALGIALEATKTEKGQKTWT